MADTGDLTRGSIRAQLISLALPMLAGDILQQLYNTVDAVIVGRAVGEEAFAAVGIAGSVMNLFLFLISGACSGVGVLLSQFYGAGRAEMFRRDCFLSAVFGGGLTLLLTVMGLWTLPPMLAVLQTPEEVLCYALPYLRVIFLGFLSAFAFHLCAAMLRAMGNTQAALVFLSVSMAANLALDVLFMIVLQGGVAGAAWATVASQLLAAALCLGYLQKNFPHMLFHRKDMVWDGPLLWRTARFGFAAALHMCSVFLGKLLVQRTVNGLGTASISAYTAATRIEGFANSFGNSGSGTMSVFIGQNTGAGAEERVSQGFSQGQRLLAGFGIAISLLMLAFANPLLHLVLPAGNGESLAPALGYLRLVACFYTLNFVGSGLAGYFRGRGQLHVPVLGAAGHISVRVLGSWLLAPLLGLPAVALATGIGWAGAVIFWYALVYLEAVRNRSIPMRG